MTLWARQQHDHTVTTREKEVPPKFDVVDCHAPQDIRSSQVDRFVKRTDVSNDGIVVQLLFVVQREDVEVTR